MKIQKWTTTPTPLNSFFESQLEDCTTHEDLGLGTEMTVHPQGTTLIVNGAKITRWLTVQISDSLYKDVAPITFYQYSPFYFRTHSCNQGLFTSVETPIVLDLKINEPKSKVGQLKINETIYKLKRTL